MHDAEHELHAALAERDRYWQALTDIAGWENWQRPTWREIAQKALTPSPDPQETTF